MARKKTMRSAQLFTIYLTGARSDRNNYKVIQEMALRTDLPQDVVKILQANVSSAFEKMNRSETRIKNWIADAVETLVKSGADMTTPINFISMFPDDPKFKMVDGKVTESTMIETDDESDDE